MKERAITCGEHLLRSPAGEFSGVSVGLLDAHGKEGILFVIAMNMKSGAPLHFLKADCDIGQMLDLNRIAVEKVLKTADKDQFPYGLATFHVPAEGDQEIRLNVEAKTFKTRSELAKYMGDNLLDAFHQHRHVQYIVAAEQCEHFQLRETIRLLATPKARYH